jgi:hypothetical protein
VNIGFSFWQMLYDWTGLWLAVALAAVYLFALLRGDKTGREFANILAIGAVLDMLLALNGRAIPQSFSAIEDQLGIEALLLAVQTALALRSARHYPIAIAAAQLLIVIAVALGAAGLIHRQESLGWLMVGLTIIQLGVFGYGLWAHRIRRPDNAGAAVFTG